MVRFILPVRGFADAKSRLRVPGIPTPLLVRAMLADTVHAALCADLGPVTVVTPDADVLAAAGELGAGGLLHPGSLNTAIAAAAGPGRNAALLPDLPALSPGELRAALREPRGFVADWTGAGTTMVFDDHLTTRFGPDSARLHEAAGLPRLDLGVCGLTVDVDTAEDLELAVGLGLGPATSALVTRERADPLS